MNDFSEYGSESTEDSNDMLWETIKVDLGLNRACQTEQLQSLKGSSVKLSPKMQKVRKRGKKSSKRRTRFHSKKAAIKTALGMIRAVNRKIKLGRRVSNASHAYTSVMNFKVFDNTPKHAVGNEPRSSLVYENTPTQKDCGNNVREGPSLKDEATQTISSEDKSLQTSLLVNANLDLCDAAHAHLPIQPKTCGMAFYPMFVSCCSKRLINVCHCSVSHQTSSHTQEILTERQVPLSDGNISTQFTLKQICEELLVQLSARKDISNKKDPEKNRKKIRKCSPETSTSLPDAAVSDLKAIVDSLKGIQSDLKNNMVPHPFVVPTNITIARTESTSPPHFKAISLKPIFEGDQRTPKPAPSTSESAPSLVTPDLLHLAQESALYAASTPNEGIQHNIETFKVPLSPKMIEEQKGFATPKKMDLLQTINWSALIPLEENSDKLLQQMLDAGLVTIVNSVDKTEHISSNVNQNENCVVETCTVSSNCKTVHTNNSPPSNMAANSTDESSNGSSVNLLNKSDDFVLKLSDESDQNMICNGSSVLKSPQRNVTLEIYDNNVSNINESEIEGSLTDSRNGLTNKLKPDECGANRFSNVSSSNNVGDLDIPRTSDVGLAQSVVLSSKQSIDKSNHLSDSINGTTSQQAEVTMDSVAFEEVDTSEMENILMVWRQQEKLHQNQNGPKQVACSNQAFKFKMTKPTHELPPELKNVRILQPPPLKKEQQLGNSVLQTLNEKENGSVEEDDVPEISPAVLPTPKKRRLSLKKNSPSPLPVVFHLTKQAAEGFKITGENSPTEDKKHSPSLNQAQLEDCKEKTLNEIDDDDTPLGMRMLRKRAAKTNKEEKTVPVSGSSIKQEIERKQPAVKKTLTLKKNVDKGKTKDVEEDPIEPPKKSKTKNAKEPTKNSKQGKSKNVEKPTDNTKKGASTKGRKKTLTYDEIVAMANDMYENKKDFHTQIKERMETMNKKWLQEKTVENPQKEVDWESKQPQPVSPALSAALDPDQLFEEKLQKLRQIPLYELGKAHDLALNILLNPWRGINARRVTRDYELPKYDNKDISRSLWDLRSGANPDDIVNRIMSLGWKELDLSALKTMVSMFVLSLSRSVPFIIEAAKTGEDDDTCSIVSDFDQNQKKKTTSVRIVATRQIFKGECIDGLNGLLLKAAPKDSNKDRLKTWVFPKFGEGRNYVILGPLAYLKRKEGNSNTEGVIIKGDIVSVKASRQILCGERLLVSYERLVKRLR